MTIAFASPPLLLAAALVAGGLLGCLHFASLGVVTRDYAQGRAGRAVLLQAARMAVMVGGLFALARLGAGPLLAAALGLLAARTLVLHMAEGAR